MKQPFVVLFLFIFSINYATAQESVVDFRFTPSLNDCSGSKVCFNVQLRLNQANQPEGSVEFREDLKLFTNPASKTEVQSFQVQK